VWAKTTGEAAAVVNKHLDLLLERIADLCDGSNRLAILMPDTSAVIHIPALEDWEFVEAKRFTILLSPTVLGELDDLKVAPRAEIRERAESAIRRIQGYMSRGNPPEGVALRRDRSVLRLLASEPRSENVLPWLDLSIKDDRHIASLIEVMRQHPRTPVMLVARDINMKNKAIYARLPYLEPPDPPPSSKPASRAVAPDPST
jgi:predicted ribonuclease YlaK